MPVSIVRSRCFLARKGWRALPLLWILGSLAASAQGPAQVPERPSTRGRLLYETHCIACHNSQMHWRDQRLARDWPGLVVQVRGWQARADLFWSEDDIVEVARHLNDTIYRFERPLAAIGRPPVPTRTR